MKALLIYIILMIIAVLLIPAKADTDIYTVGERSYIESIEIAQHTIHDLTKEKKNTNCQRKIIYIDSRIDVQKQIIKLSYQILMESYNWKIGGNK